MLLAAIMKAASGAATQAATASQAAMGATGLQALKTAAMESPLGKLASSFENSQWNQAFGGSSAPPSFMGEAAPYTDSNAEMQKLIGKTGIYNPAAGQLVGGSGEAPLMPLPQSNTMAPIIKEERNLYLEELNKAEQAEREKQITAQNQEGVDQGFIYEPAQEIPYTPKANPTTLAE